MITLGSSQNPPLVFLHGFLGSGKSWREIFQINKLSEQSRNGDINVALQDQYFCILPDLPGHGENTKLDFSTTISFDFVTDWLFHLLDEIPAPKIHLVGYSLGGRVALHFATRYPEQIHSLILESANAGIIDEAERARRLAEDSARAESMLRDGMPAFVEKWYDMPLFASLKNHPEKISAIKEAAKQNNPRWMAKVIVELSPGLQTPLWDSLSELSFPVLLIAGAKDEKYVQVMQKMAEQIPSAQKNILPEAGHNVHAEQPEVYIELLKNFLSEVVE
jgi:2-succinyl-6-hydroxy-2,4-cyclohexadiene-1-carboxylate synthase